MFLNILSYQAHFQVRRDELWIRSRRAMIAATVLASAAGEVGARPGHYRAFLWLLDQPLQPARLITQFCQLG